MNARFYERYAEQFDGTRMSGWAGWGELIALLHRERPLRVLDLGCGNGRLAWALARAQRQDPALQLSHYHGVDRCLPLLETARDHTRRQELSFSCSWSPWAWGSLTPQDPPHPPSAEGRWSWVTLFGVTHHIFGFERRLELLAFAAQQLEPGGLLSASFWDFGASSRWDKKRVPWSHLSAEWGEDLSLIEEDDALLGWGGSEETLRYCHWVSPQEEETLSEALCERLKGALSLRAVTRDPEGHNRYRTWAIAP